MFVESLSEIANEQFSKLTEIESKSFGVEFLVERTIRSHGMTPNNSKTWR